MPAAPKAGGNSWSPQVSVVAKIFGKAAQGLYRHSNAVRRARARL